MINITSLSKNYGLFEAVQNISFQIKKGDVVLSPDGEGSYFVGEITDDYQYLEGSDKPHRRKINWESDLTWLIR